MYYTLLAALPWLAPLAKLSELPCSTLKLEQRLTMLTDADGDRLHRALELCRCERSAGEDLSDHDAIALWQRELAALGSAPLGDVIAEYLESCSLMAALRYRRAGLTEGRSFTGFGPRVWLVRRNWQQPLFGLERHFPWLKRANALLEAESVRELEDLLVERFWQRLWWLQQESGFDFAAVAAYRLRWELAEYRLRWDGKEAQQEYDHLVDGALEDFNRNQISTTGRNE